MSDPWLAGSRSCDPSMESLPTQKGPSVRGRYHQKGRCHYAPGVCSVLHSSLGESLCFLSLGSGEDDKTIHSLLDEHFSTALQFFLLRIQSFVRCLVQTSHSAKTINFGAERLGVSTERLELDPNSLPLFARDFLIYRCGHRWNGTSKRKTGRVRLKDGGVDLDWILRGKSKISGVTITITCTVTMTRAFSRGAVNFNDRRRGRARAQLHRTELARPYVFPVQSTENDLDSPLSVKDTFTTVAH